MRRATLPEKSVRTPSLPACYSLETRGNRFHRFNRGRETTTPSPRFVSTRKGDMAAILTAMRARLTALARAEGDQIIEKNVLKVVVGAIESLASSKSQGSKPVTDDQEVKEVKKVIEGNEESMRLMRERGMESDARYKALSVENTVLMPFVPSSLSQAEILAALGGIENDIKGAKSDGQAVGVAMKLFKGQGARVDGADVTAVVQNMRK
jgi:hypothetical protein